MKQRYVRRVTCPSIPVNNYVAGLGQLLNDALHHLRGFLPWASPRHLPIHELRIHIGEVENGITLGNVEEPMYQVFLLRLEGESTATTNVDANPESHSLQSSKTSE